MTAVSRAVWPLTLRASTMARFASRSSAISYSPPPMAIMKGVRPCSLSWVSLLALRESSRRTTSRWRARVNASALSQAAASTERLSWLLFT
ncbi:hypothetical protein D3C86_2012120 [compost metagenome]